MNEMRIEEEEEEQRKKDCKGRRGWDGRKGRKEEYK